MTKKIFLAFDIPWRWSRALADAQKDLKRRYSELRLTPSRNFHCTIAFYGLLDEPALRRLITELDTGLSSLSSFPVTPDTFGFFKSRGRVVLWYGVRSEPLATLARFARKFIVGEQPENFRGHITLGRLNDHRDLLNAVYPSLKLSGFVVREVVLYESVNDMYGPKYLKIKKWRLRYPRRIE